MSNDEPTSNVIKVDFRQKSAERTEVKALSKTFDDVDNRTLKAWNRFAIYYNLVRDKNKEMADKYMLSFDKRSRMDVDKICEAIVEFGYEETKAMVIKGDDLVGEG